MRILKRKRMMKTWISVLLTAVILCVGCSHKSKDTVETKSLDDLENAISVIRVRRESEHKIISQEEYAISVLTENIGKSNSEGMKDKIRDEIVVKRAVITKAKKNIANQDLILEELSGKRDSIEVLNTQRIE